ncbi:helix-turn-helix domain-containing protein [Terasakiella pusilla]|uniref:helix-turn-helix domain-containing protein n=1 Tax=Terasakiella pusilla TaxID=64973 RepID=UPI003AA85048
MDKKPTDANPIDKTAGERLKLRRTLMGYSQKQLGEAVGVSRLKIGQFETGKSSIPASLLYKFSDLLKVDIAFFFHEDTASTCTRTRDILSHEALSLMRDYRALDNPEVRTAFARMMERAAQLNKSN